MSFNPNPVRLKQDYLDVFEGIRTEVINTVKYDENSDIGTTYLWTFRIKRQDDLRAEHKTSITEVVERCLLTSSY